jgi:hypothetical protein
MKPADLFFDHGERAGLALTGKHGEAACESCHAGSRMSLARGKRDCANCHAKESPHGKAFARKDCSECHATAQSWKGSRFDHDTTGFPLKAEHKTKRCGGCHKKADQKPDPECRSCHKDPHKDRFDQDCRSCHGKSGGRKEAKFAHAERTKFALTGKHASLSCRSCHRGKGPKRFERFETGDCMSCHAHTNAHNGEFRDKPCLGCHKEGGSQDLKFDHDKDSRFALTGFHQELEDRGECKKCHPKNKANTFRINKLACVDCHQDAHQGQLGAQCERCHSTSVHFKEIVFDHDRLSRFALEGKHEEAKCESCHPEKRYKIDKLACVDCHREDDPHQAKLGTECQRCHLPVPGAPKFDHESMTNFQRTGVHKAAECSSCHRAPLPEPPKRGWTAQLPEESLDKLFPVMGKVCADCHFDQHNGSYGKACESCHDTTDFRKASRAVHDTGAFRLQGTHDLLACARCHQPRRPLAGLGALCGECHRSDDIHNLSLGLECGRCHLQVDWFPQRFNHATVGFALRGAHLTARCNDCHTIGRYLGTPRECTACHLVASQRVADPVHDPGAMNECRLCHTEATFRPARPYHPWFPLSGSHATVACSSCHSGGRYSGTADDCGSCHRLDYLGAQRPNHVAAGFAESCELCHQPVTWTGARYQHRSFILRGVHRALACDRCHLGERYDGAFGGAVAAYECRSCHGVAGPVARRPADHDPLGYPETCELCHQETAWIPARKPR